MAAMGSGDGLAPVPEDALAVVVEALLDGGAASFGRSGGALSCKNLALPQAWCA